MNTFQDIYDAYTTATKNTVTANQTTGKGYINDTENIVLAMRSWKFLEQTDNITTVASTSAYELPLAKDNQIISVRVTVGSVKYRPKIVESYEFWEYLQGLNTGESNVMQYVYVQGNQLLTYPTPSSSGSTIRVRSRKRHKDMTQANYTTGTITTATSGGDDIVGSGTSWTVGMAAANGHIRITNIAGAAGGDGEWYEIETVDTTTTLTIVKNYEGTTLAAASAAYTIGELPLIPQTHIGLLLYRSLALYYMHEGEDFKRSDRFWRLYDGGYEAGLSKKQGGMVKSLMDAYSGGSEAMSLEPLPEHERSIHDLEISDSVEGESW